MKFASDRLETLYYILDEERKDLLEQLKIVEEQMSELARKVEWTVEEILQREA